MINHFDSFEMAIDFAIDLDALENKYLAFQKKFHPDNASTADIEKSILVNQSYDVLKNPLTRAAHILQLNGIDLENDEKAPKPDFETLEEILELQEKLADIDTNEKQDLKKYLNSTLKDLLNQAATEINHQNFTQAAQILIRAKYYNKTLKDLKSKK